MKLIVGLGNPGHEYEKTRHNAGFMALDALQTYSEAAKFSLNNKIRGLVCKGKIGRKQFILLKPETFMNESGISVVAALNFYKLTSNDLIVIHDDKDIPLGLTKIQSDRGDAGHNGVKSVIEQLGTKNFTRLRIGIAPEDKKIFSTADYVLQKFSESEIEKLTSVFKNTSEEIKSLL